jgi:2-haloacid dehalogenase
MALTKFRHAPHFSSCVMHCLSGDTGFCYRHSRFLLQCIRMITTVVFDLGNVLIPWNPYWLFRKLLPDDGTVARFLQEVDFAAWNAGLDAGHSFAESIEDLGQRFPHYRHLAQAYLDRWDEAIGPTIPESLAVLHELKAAGLRVLALTNFARETFAKTRLSRPFLAEFEGIVVSGEVRLTKPDPAIYELLFERHGVSATEAVFIDDSAANIATASTLGMHTVHFTAPECLRPALRELHLPV